MDEDRLHQAILEGINEFVQAGQDLGDELLDIASTIQQGENTEYEDVITRKYVEKITVVDADTIRIRFKYTEIEIDKAVRE